MIEAALIGDSVMVWLALFKRASLKPPFMLPPSARGMLAPVIPTPVMLAPIIPVPRLVAPVALMLVLVLVLRVVREEPICI